MKKVAIVLGIGLIVIGVVWILSQKKINEQRPTINEKIEIRTEQKKERKEVGKIAVMADVHNDTETLQKALQQADDDEWVILAGDLTINGTEKEELVIKKVLDDRERLQTVPYYVVPGNHDDYKNLWLFGEKYQVVRKNGWKLILIDNSNWWGLGEEQKKWIESESEECKVVYCLAIMHKPLVHNFSNHVMGESNKKATEEAKWLKEVLVKNGVKMGYSGHLHYSSSYTIDDWETVLVGAITKDRNAQTPRYTEVTLYDDGSVENNVKFLMSNDK